jgi:hypothetical protein
VAGATVQVCRVEPGVRRAYLYHFANTAEAVNPLDLDPMALLFWTVNLAGGPPSHWWANWEGQRGTMGFYQGNCCFWIPEGSVLTVNVRNASAFARAVTAELVGFTLGE